MTGKEAKELSRRSETWLRNHSCAWCGQTLWRALRNGCCECDLSAKDFRTNAEMLKAARAVVQIFL